MFIKYGAGFRAGEVTSEIIKDGAILNVDVNEVAAIAGSKLDPVIPNIIANLLTDHDKVTHDALNIDADTIDGAHAGLDDGDVAKLPIATEGKVLRRGATAWEIGDAGDMLKSTYDIDNDGIVDNSDKVDGVDIPNTIANILTDHDKITHDVVDIDADTVDGAHAGVLDGNVALLPTATEGKVLRRGATAWEAGDVVVDVSWYDVIMFVNMAR